MRSGTLLQLLERGDLSEAEAAELLRALTDADMPPALAGALLAALRSKGVTADEVRGFARAMRALARRPDLPPGLRAIDIVGTGGDSSGSFNLSTGAALLTAACGVDVVKHGNRSVSSQSGSADVLEQLGLKLPLDESAAGACLAATRFTFLFAPHYHPAMKAVAPDPPGDGRAHGVQHPRAADQSGGAAVPAHRARSTCHARSSWPRRCRACRSSAPSSSTARRAGTSPRRSGRSRVLDVRPGEVTRQMRSPSDYGLDLCGARDLAGGDAATMRRRCARCSTGEERGAHRDCLLLGTALALEVVGAVARAARGRRARRGGHRQRRGAPRVLEALAAVAGARP